MYPVLDEDPSGPQPGWPGHQHALSALEPVVMVVAATGRSRDAAAALVIPCPTWGVSERSRCVLALTRHGS